VAPHVRRARGGPPVRPQCRPYVRRPRRRSTAESLSSPRRHPKLALIKGRRVSLPTAPPRRPFPCPPPATFEPPPKPLLCSSLASCELLGTSPSTCSTPPARALSTSRRILTGDHAAAATAAGRRRTPVPATLLPQPRPPVDPR
jgi:hypothetical protein